MNEGGVAKKLPERERLRDIREYERKHQQKNSAVPDEYNVCVARLALRERCDERHEPRAHIVETFAARGTDTHAGNARTSASQTNKASRLGHVIEQLQ